MILSPPTPFFRSGNIKNLSEIPFYLVCSRVDPGLIQVKPFFTKFISSIKTTIYKKMIQVIQVIQVDSYLLHMRAHVCVYLFLYLVFIKNHLDHLDQIVMAGVSPGSFAWITLDHLDQ